MHYLTQVKQLLIIQSTSAQFTKLINLRHYSQTKTLLYFIIQANKTCL